MDESSQDTPADLLCPLCLELFEKATLLSCGHTFCRECLTSMDENTPKKPKAMACPLCRKNTTLTADRIKGLPRNITVDSLVSEFHCMKLKTLPRHQPSEKLPKNPSRRLSGGVLYQRVSAENRPLPAIPVTETLQIMKTVSLPGGMRGMAALSSDTVIIGYGSSIPGAESISTSGVRKKYLDGSIGTVRDIATFEDGRLVVSQEANNMREFNSSGSPTDRQFKAKTRSEFHFNICSNGIDTIYAVNGQREIYIFKMGQSSPQRVIATGGSRPWQVCVTSAGTIICCMDIGSHSKNAVVAYDKDGHQGTIIKTEEGAVNKYLYAAVDNQDRLFIACINPVQGTFQLTIYGVSGGRLDEQFKLETLQLPKTEFIWHYMVCLTPRVIAVANLARKLYFIKVPVLQRPASVSF